MEPVRFGLIGYGAWGSHHAAAIAQTAGAELTAVAVPSPQSRAAARSAHPHARAYEDYRDLLAREELDVVDVVVPSHLHHEIGLAVLASGRHLLLEKPMGLTADQCDELIARAASAGKVLAVGHELRCSALWGKVKEMIDAGTVGDVQYQLIELWRRPYRLGSGGWRYDVRRVGNWVLEEPIHFFDLARWYFARAGEAVSVYARAGSRQEGHPELQDHFSAVLNFPGGGYAVITQTLGAFEHHQTVKISGTRGALWANWSGALDRDPRPRFALRHGDGERVVDVPLAGTSGEVYELEAQIARVVEAVRGGKPPPATGADGRWSVALCQAAQRSVETGAVVLLEGSASSTGS